MVRQIEAQDVARGDAGEVDQVKNPILYIVVATLIASCIMALAIAYLTSRPAGTMSLLQFGGVT